MTQVTLVLVDISSQEVIDLRPAEALATLPAALPNSYWLKPGIDFPATRIVTMGWIWDGTRDPLNTNFNPPPAVSGDLASLTAAEILALMETNAVRDAQLQAALKANLGG